ncbi:hypothetical protein AXI70_gp10 [Cronobacter phage Dev-CD-23823]|uniref:Uncharacterized protein n=1 Tax=Cronobacter phage Dev-CD-23823 TaxID=1712539 RepID=A0A0K8IY04_9CAUD|nr:hypothetical protein AXI70_gp10 [Cronobacter phage Dev-CD-23823]CUH74585.1 hypothetical protein [Cronobacter phage Dev-CD-23823]
MIKRMHVIVIPTINIHDVRRVVQREHFDFQPAAVRREHESAQPVLVVTARDFHDVGVLLDKAGTLIKPVVYLVDGKNAAFKYDQRSRELESLGYLMQNPTWKSEPSDGWSVLTVQGNDFKIFGVQ